MQVHKINANKNPQIEPASSKIELSLLQLSVLAKEAEILKNNRLTRRDIIIGSISRAITIITIIPQELFILDRLATTVFKASLTVEPTIGMKLLIANLAVLMERVSDA